MCYCNMTLRMQFDHKNYKFMKLQYNSVILANQSITAIGHVSRLLDRKLPILFNQEWKKNLVINCNRKT